MPIQISFHDGSNIDKTASVGIEELVQSFVGEFSPLDTNLIIFSDARTGAYYIESHLMAENILELSTIDVPLDPEEQSDYRANREIVEDHTSFMLMKEDASKGRTFSNIVAEYNIDFDAKHPLKIIGGQHRLSAIKSAYENGDVNVPHGIKIYFGLSNDQRLDVQLISNTNIAVAADLLDRMLETVKGPELRDWSQEVGLLSTGKDFADKKSRNNEITVRLARSFILSYLEGRVSKDKKFDTVNPSPVIAKTGGVIDDSWEKSRIIIPSIWADKKLKKAAQEFSRLINRQNDYFSKQTSRNNEYASKALNYSIVSAWAFIAGVLEGNEVRLVRHFNLADRTGKDPLNAGALAKGKHKTDPENYRGLGTRTDVKERGRLSELFYFQAEKGEGISPKLVDASIKQYHAKLAALDAEKARESLG
ncbi:MAG: hypothetical protein KBT53_03080 [Porticoccus sp.]|nr:hypothetical protein [Porticoccus sp.]MBQ0807409.1 hypothetical protein [Porticoccus sp.]